MRRSVFLCAAAAVVSMMTAKAQDVETIYFDKDGQEVKVKEFAEYYRIIESGDTYPKAFLDYYMDGTKSEPEEKWFRPMRQGLWSSKGT